MNNKLINLVKKYQTPCEFLLAIIISLGIAELFGIISSRKFFLMGLILIAVYSIVHFGIKNINRRRFLFSLFFAIPFGIAFWFGEKIVVYQSYTLNSVSILDILILLALICLFILISLIVLSFIDQNCFLKGSRVIKNKQWIIYSLIIFLSWVPLFLIFFPGFISVDSAVQIRQAVGEGNFSNWHPVLHTAVIALCIRIGNLIFGDLTSGIAISTILQMIIIAIIYGYTVKWIINKTSKKWIGYILIGFFALCPTIACYSITMWKDVYFSSVFLLLIIKVYDFIELMKREDKLSLKALLPILLIALLLAFLRNGGILVILVLGLGLFIYYKKSRLLIGCSFIVIILTTVIIQGPIYTILNINSSPFMESMSVPAQQLGYVAANGVLTEDEKDELSVYADVDKLSENYTPMNADPAKNSFYYDKVNEDKVGFLTMWFRILAGHFGSFVKAYVLHTYSYWYPQGDVWVLDMEHVHDDKWLEADYEDVAIFGDTIRGYSQKIETELTQSVFWGWTNNVGVMFWGVLYVFLIFLYQERYKMIIPVACIIIYMISLLIASPVSWIFRYVYALLLILPVLVILCFKTENPKKIKVKKH